MDTQLIVRQLNGLYKIKSEKLKPLATAVMSIKTSLGNEISFIFIRREKNKLADQLVNEAMDKFLAE